MLRCQLSRKGRGSARCAALKPSLTLLSGMPSATHSSLLSVTSRAMSHSAAAGRGLPVGLAESLGEAKAQVGATAPQGRRAPELVTTMSGLSVPHLSLAYFLARPSLGSARSRRRQDPRAQPLLTQPPDVSAAARTEAAALQDARWPPGRLAAWPPHLTV